MKGKNAMKEFTITINFDMDGTIADFYGVDGWLDYLNEGNVFPYANAKPLLHFASFARKLNNLQKEGYRIAIISWLSKTGTEEYNKEVTKTKIEWLAKHLPSVNWDEINIIPYGTPKQNYCNNIYDILFDDEERNRNNWTGNAFDVRNIMDILKSL